MSYANEKSIISTTPEMISKYGHANEGANLVVNKENVFRLFINGLTGTTRLPTSIVPEEVAKFVNVGTGIVSKEKPFIRFLMQSVQLNFNESITFMKNLSEGYVTYVFGEEPPMAACSGILLHTEADNWSEQFLALYTYVLRATKLAQLSVVNNTNMSLSLAYQGKTLTGTMFNLTKATNANNEQGTSFTFQFAIKKLDISWAGTRNASVDDDAGVISRGDPEVYNNHTSTRIAQVDSSTNGAFNNPAFFPSR